MCKKGKAVYGYTQKKKKMFMCKEEKICKCPSAYGKGWMHMNALLKYQ